MTYHFLISKFVLKILLVSVFSVIFAKISLSQVHGRSNYFLNVQASAGTSVPIGSFSKNSTKVNTIGKYQWSASVNIRVDAVFKNKYTFGLALDYDFCTVRNEYLFLKLNEKYAPKKDSIAFSPDNAESFDLIIERYSLTASKIIQKKNLIIQPKIYLSLCHIVYEYRPTYILKEPANTAYLSDLQTYDYSSEGKFVLNIAPELNIKYIILKKTWLDLAINFGIRFTYLSPKIKITESKRDFASFNKTTTDYTSLKDPMTLLNMNLGVQWLF